MSKHTSSHLSKSQQHGNDSDISNEGEASTAGQQKQVHHKIHINRRRSKQSTKLSIDIWKLSLELIPNYNRMSKRTFKNLLLTWYPADDGEELAQQLTNRTLLSFTQRYAHLICIKYQLEMEQSYWKHIIDGLLSAINWLSQMPKYLTSQYSIDWDYSRTEHNVRHRLRSTENKLNKIYQQIEVHLQQYSSCWSTSDRALMDETMDMLNDAVKELVYMNIEDLDIKFEQKKTLIQYDAKDIDLLKSFLDLAPTTDQKRNAAKIWRGKRKLGQRQIQQVKADLLNDEEDVTPMIVNGNHHHNTNHQQYLMGLLESFDLPMRTIIENRQQNIENRTQQMISFEYAPRCV